jgi:integrase
MSIYRDKENGCWRFEFDRRIPGKGRVRARKRLPKTWSRAQADKFDRAESERLYGIATGIEKPDASIDEAVAIYAAERLANLKAGRRTLQELRQVEWAFVGKPITALADVCSAIRKRYAGELAPATIANRINYLCAACRYAWKHHSMCEHNPRERVVLPTVRNERQVYTDRTWMLYLCQLARDCRETRALVRIGFYTGMRLGEIMRSEVDHERGMLMLPDTKNGEPRWIPVHRRIRCLLRYLPFDAPRSTLEKRWRAVRDAAGMPHLHFHDLRHTTASEMIRAGVSLYTVGKVLGHRSVVSTARYSHLATDQLADALGMVGGKKRA